VTNLAENRRGNKKQVEETKTTSKQARKNPQLPERGKLGSVSKSHKSCMVARAKRAV